MWQPDKLTDNYNIVSRCFESLGVKEERPETE